MSQKIFLVKSFPNVSEIIQTLEIWEGIVYLQNNELDRLEPVLIGSMQDGALTSYYAHFNISKNHHVYIDDGDILSYDMFDRLSGFVGNQCISKRRYVIAQNEEVVIWDLDVYQDKLSGIIIARFEVQEGETFELPKALKDIATEIISPSPLSCEFQIIKNQDNLRKRYES